MAARLPFLPVLAGCALLLVGACGGAGPCGPGAYIQVREVESLSTYGPYYGVTEIDCDGPTQVLILASTPPQLLERLVAHELLHAVGLTAHEDDPSCYLYENILGTVLTVPCPQEVARLLQVEGSFEVEVMDLSLEPAVDKAIQLWNAVAGRDLFTRRVPDP